MPTKHTCLAAWTEPGHPYPDYVSINRDVAAGGVTFSIRCDNGETHASITLPDAEFASFLRELNDRTSGAA